MAISESQLETWSHQGSISQSATTYQTIKAALEESNAPFSNRKFDIFLQGSYGNDTNIYGDSDVDIAICLTSTIYLKTDSLSAPERALHKEDHPPLAYGFHEFKAEVLRWLQTKFGAGVQAGGKAIFIPGNGFRRNADVLVCVEHREYMSYGRASLDDYHEGVVFWTRDGREIINYPKQHRDNCTSKHQSTASRFKPNVRVIKNIRNAMLASKLIEDGEAPSYFLEGMLSNVPSTQFTNSYAQTFLNAIDWLSRCDPQSLTCVNGRHYLIRDGHHVCWNMADFFKTRSAMRTFWERSPESGRRTL